MERANKKLIAVVGATGQQGGAVVRALQRSPLYIIKIVILRRMTEVLYGVKSENKLVFE